MNLAFEGGPLHRKHRVYLDRVTVAAIPEEYEDRLTEIFRAPTDTFASWLSTLTTSHYRSWSGTIRKIVTMYASSPRRFLDLSILQERYDTELRWQLGRPDREDLTLRLWMEMLSE